MTLLFYTADKGISFMTKDVTFLAQHYKTVSMQNINLLFF
jgi:hypothetical protein